MNPKMMEAIKKSLGDDEFAALSKKIEEKGMMKVLGKELLVNKKLRKMMMETHKGGGDEKRLAGEVEDEFATRLKSHHNSSGVLDNYFKTKKFTEDEFLTKLKDEPKDVPRAIYVHTPYCDKICSFCNLNREQINGSLDEYAKYIADEFDRYGATRYMQARPFNVVYFGGGTPTVYKAYQLELILQSVNRNVDFVDDYEFTLETTLHNLNDEKIALMNKYGVNRLSVGIQSFSDAGRVFYNRTYNKEEVKRRIIDLKSKFNGEVCADIIYNFPNQTIEEVREDAKIIKELDLGSSSFYSLMVHEGSDLSKDLDKGRVKMQDKLSRERELHDVFVEELTNTDEYYSLELTKIAKRGRDSYQYIKVRNAGGDTLPIGVGAGGRVDNIGLFRMSKEMSFFVEKTEHYLTFEKLSGLMQFPLVEKSKVREILTDREYDVFQEKMKEFSEKKLLEIHENGYKLTHDGIFWGNNMSKALLKTMAETLFGKKLDGDKS